jgi:cysteine-rich repeat protein
MYIVALLAACSSEPAAAVTPATAIMVTEGTCGDGKLDAGEECDDGNGSNGDGCNNDCTSGAFAQRAYIKASNTNGGDIFGSSVALSADGSTLAVGAFLEASAATGVGGDQSDDSATGAGAVYVFTRSGATWIQQAYLKASNASSDDWFGHTIALSADGSTLAVSALREASAATGIDGDQADNSTDWAGAVYVFTRSGTTWSQQAYVKASNTGYQDIFGVSLALSADGSTLAVGAPDESSAATGINGNQADDSAQGAGAVYVFTRSGAAWSQQAYVKASNTSVNYAFGMSVALSGDASILAVGSPNEPSGATGIDGDQLDVSAGAAGAVYVFRRSGTGWAQQAYVKASNTGASDWFGNTIALSGDGSTLAVGAIWEASAATGINGDQADDSAAQSGAVYIFTSSSQAQAQAWSQQAYLKASNTEAGDYFSDSLALSGDGSTLVVGAPFEDSTARGIAGDEADNSAEVAGAAYVFSRAGGAWRQQAYVKASNTGPEDIFGDSVAISADGFIVAVGARSEASAATGIEGDQADDSAAGAGAVYVFR